VFAGSSLSPDLRIGTISAFFPRKWKTAQRKALLMGLAMIGAITGELSFRILAFTLSRPVNTQPLVPGYVTSNCVFFGLFEVLLH